MRNLFLITILFFLACSINLFSDSTDDITSIDNIDSFNFKKKDETQNFRDKADYFMKFRGHTQFVLTWYPPYHDGVNPGDHTAQFDSNPLDYTDKGDPDKKHHTGTGRTLNYTGTEFKIYYKFDMIAPFLTTDHFMFSGNNLTMSLLYEISPISMNAGAELTFTPIVFLNFKAGFLIGPAWNIPNFAGGIGYNSDDGISRYDFYGPHLQLWFSSTFQMDFGYVVPEKFQRFMHIVMFATPIIKYQALLTIPETVPYMYEEDKGENLNGWRFLGDFFLGYMIPVIEDDIGNDRTFIKMRHKRLSITTGMYFRIEKIDLTHYFKSTMNSKDGWGSDFTTVEFGPILRLELPYNFWTILFVFFANDKAYTSETVGNVYYQDRVYEDWYIYFKRIGFFIGWDF